jgi:two-component system sensor histidine kinase UhpB
MVEQHEEERRRLSLELHDETAQVFSAVKLQLGILRERVPREVTDRVERVIGLVDAGMRSIRNVTDELRPSLLDDLGLVPALRALVADFGERTGLVAEFTGPESLTGLSDAAELAIFRAVQEGLSNVARHSAATRVDVALRSENGKVQIDVQDNGQGPGPDPDGAGRMGLAGMRERILALGGTVTLDRARESGAWLGITLPRSQEPGA